MTDNAQPAVYGATPQQIAAIQTFYKGFEGQSDLLDQVVTPDWQDIPLAPNQQPGREGVKPLIAGFKAAFPDTKVVIHEVIGAGDRIAVRATISGTHTGSWFGVAPTGKTFQLTIHEFHRLQDGMLTHTWHLEDWLGWLFQVEAWPVAKESDR